MSKKFRPLFSVEGKETLREDVSRAVINQLRREVEALSKENATLKEEIERLRAEIEERNSEMRSLREEVRREETQRRVMEEFRRVFEDRRERLKGELREEFLGIARAVIEEFLMSDVIPKGDVVMRVLEEVFEKVTDLKGKIGVFLNPRDVERVRDLLDRVRREMGGKVEIEVVTDSTLSEGEVRVETPRFVIERKNREALEEIFGEVMRRVSQRGEGVREGGQG